MTFKIKLSELPMPLPEFEARVKAFFESLVEYFRHLEGVQADAANPDLTPEERRVAFPAPSEDPLVEAAVRREAHDDGSLSAHVDYEVQGPTLEEKKVALTAEVRAKETAAVHSVMPPAKVRHWHFREQDILKAHAPNIPTGSDGIFIEEMKVRREKAAAVSRWAAKHEHDIHDLTEENVDQYKVGGEFA